jgi:hypothetical protein
MKKIKLLVGVAAGFILGSRAGRGPYEKVEAQAKKVLNRGDVQETLDHATAVATEKLSAVTDKVEAKLPGDHEKTADSDTEGDVGAYP